MKAPDAPDAPVPPTDRSSSATLILTARPSLSADGFATSSGVPVTSYLHAGAFGPPATSAHSGAFPASVSPHSPDSAANDSAAAAWQGFGGEAASPAQGSAARRAQATLDALGAIGPAATEDIAPTWRWGWSLWIGVHYGPIPVGIIVVVVLWLLAGTD